MAKTTSKLKNKKQPNAFMKLVNKATATRRAVFTTGLVGVLLFSGVGYYVVNRSSAAVTAASVCGGGYSVIKSDTQGLYVNYYLLKNTTAKKFCAVTLSKGSAYGVSKPMLVDAYLRNKSTGSWSREAKNSGSFKYYAGPVYVSYDGVSGQKWEMWVQYGQTYKGFTSQGKLFAYF
jgi:hypothetical protein